MGAVHSACDYWQHRLGWGGVPDTQRATYFADALLLGAYELLACPSAMGCTIVQFEQGNPNGGSLEYALRPRLSHSEHIPRYQLHMVDDGRTEQWIVGHMEKTESHMWAKPGEFVSVQVWKLTCNQMVMEECRSARRCPFTNGAKLEPRPSPNHMLMMGMTICTQAKIDYDEDEDGVAGILNEDTERWVESIGVEDPSYMLTVEPPGRYLQAIREEHKTLRSLRVMRILWDGRKVCTARKQRFAGASGSVEQPYLGVQIRPDQRHKQQGEDTEGAFTSTEAEAEGAALLESLLDTRQLMLLLLCLAWSEGTMSPAPDARGQLVEAMRRGDDGPGSARALGVSVSWGLGDVRRRLKHVPYFACHDWGEDARRSEPRVEERGAPSEARRGSPRGSPIGRGCEDRAAL